MALTRAGASDIAARLFGGAPERVRALMRAAWPLAVGPELSRRTEVLGIERGTLRIRVPDARWRTVLHGMQPDILRRLREIAGSLAPWRIGFVEGGMKDADPLPPPAVPGEPGRLAGGDRGPRGRDRGRGDPRAVPGATVPARVPRERCERDERERVRRTPN